MTPSITYEQAISTHLKEKGSVTKEETFERCECEDFKERQATCAKRDGR